MTGGERPPRVLVLQLPVMVSVALKIAITALVVAALHFGRDILVPLALAGLLAFLLDPLVARLRRWHLPRSVAVGVVTLVTLAALGGASVLLGLQLAQLGKNLPEYQTTIEKKLRNLRQSILVDRSLHSATRLIDAVGHEVDATRKALEAPATTAASRDKAPLRVVVTAAAPSALTALGAWVMPVLEPLLTGAIAAVLLIFILLERHDLRDRLLRLVGGDMHPMTDALNEAANRVSRYLTMQMLINIGYGVPLALGLWLIGVPGALLWGVVAGVLRFVPYVGPMVAALFPLALAFAVDPGWNMLLWTLLLVLVIELISNNLIEPWLYGASTGLAAVAVLLSAAFWTVLWGPVGLVLATPLTVCLVVMGRHLPQLRFLDLLLGSDPVFDAPTRLYQRLLAGNVDEAIELAEAQIKDQGLTDFYSRTAVPALGMAASDHIRVASAEHRHRVSSGVASLLRELRLEHPVPAVKDPAVLCIGLGQEADTLAADMLAHDLSRAGLPAQALPAAAIGAERIGHLSLGQVRVVCLSSFNSQPEAVVRQACRRLRRLHPELAIVLALWRAPALLREPGAAQALGVAALTTSLAEARQRVQGFWPEDGVPDPGALDEVFDSQAATDACQRLGEARVAAGTQAAQRTAEVFASSQALVWWADDLIQRWQREPLGNAANNTATAFEPMRDAFLRPLLAHGRPVIVPDLARDTRLGVEIEATSMPHRFLAAVPLLGQGKQIVGALCILDAEARGLDAAETRLLQALARDLMARVDAEVGIAA